MRLTSLKVSSRPAAVAADAAGKNSFGSFECACPKCWNSLSPQHSKTKPQKCTISGTWPSSIANRRLSVESVSLCRPRSRVAQSRSLRPLDRRSEIHTLQCICTGKSRATGHGHTEDGHARTHLSASRCTKDAMYEYDAASLLMSTVPSSQNCISCDLLGNKCQAPISKRFAGSFLSLTKALLSALHKSYHSKFCHTYCLEPIRMK